MAEFTAGVQHFQSLPAGQEIVKSMNLHKELMWAFVFALHIPAALSLAG